MDQWKYQNEIGSGRKEIPIENGYFKMIEVVYILSQKVLFYCQVFIILEKYQDVNWSSFRNVYLIWY